MGRLKDLFLNREIETGFNLKGINDFANKYVKYKKQMCSQNYQDNNVLAYH